MWGKGDDERRHLGGKLAASESISRYPTTKPLHWEMKMRPPGDCHLIKNSSEACVGHSRDPRCQTWFRGT